MLKPVITALTSFGISGRVFHAPFLSRSPQFKTAMVLERSKSLSGTVFPNAQIVRNYEEILNDKNIELVIINTPDHLHFEMTKKALCAGKHVVVEKPFTQTFAEAEELISLARNMGLLLTVYQNRRFDGDFLTIKNILEEGILGRIVEYESRMDRYSPDITAVWREKDTGKNGSLFNLGSHIIDQAILFFGKPEMVTANLKKLREGSSINDFCDLRLHYLSKSVTLKSSYLAAEPAPRFRINGENGSLVKCGFDTQEYYMRKKAGIAGVNESASKESLLLKVIKQGRSVVVKRDLLQGNYGIYYELLYRAIRNGDVLPVSTEHALLNMQILEKALESHHKKSTITII